MVSGDDIKIDPPAEGVVVDPLAWFDSPGPFELEIGCGKGGFLLSRAKVDPQVRLLGIEWANRYYRYCADRMARRGVRNVRVMRTDAKVFVIRHLPPACVSVLHLYHPDPWPKKRHSKRRLVQPDFVESVIRTLEKGGRWLIQTDFAEYYDHITEMIGGFSDLRMGSWDELKCAVDSDWAGTNFEIKYTREGRRIYRAAYQVV